MKAKPKEWNATDARFRDTKNKEYENRELFDAESKCNEILEKFILKMKRKEDILISIDSKRSFSERIMQILKAKYTTWI